MSWVEQHPNRVLAHAEREAGRRPTRRSPATSSRGWRRGGRPAGSMPDLAEEGSYRRQRVPGTVLTPSIAP